MKTFLLLLTALVVGGSSLTAQEHDIRVARYRGDKACAVSYTFDDGLAEHYTLAAPELEKRGFRGTFFINGSKINPDGQQVRDTTRATWGQLKEMAQRGHEIANHGWAHRNFARFPLEVIREDIRRNDSAIQAYIGLPSLTFAYPNNNKSQPGRSIAVQNRVGTRTEQWSVGSKRQLADLNRWVDKLIADGGWGVGMTHGLTYGYDAFRNPQRLWDHWDYVKAHEAQVWVGTFAEVAAYVNERDAVTLDVERNKNKLTVTPSLTLDRSLFTQPLTLVVALGQARKVSARQDGKKLAVTVKGDKALIDFNPHGGSIRIRLR